MAGQDPLGQKALPPQLDAMRKELAGADPSVLERLLAERIAACWLQLQYAEVVYAQNFGGMNIAQSDLPPAPPGQAAQALPVRDKGAGADPAGKSIYTNLC